MSRYNPPLIVDWENLEKLPWEKLPGETPKAFAAFQVYREMDPHERGKRAAAGRIGKHYTMIQDWSNRFHWNKRIEAWDSHADAVRLAAQEHAIAEMSDRHARVAMTMLSKVAARLVGVEEGHADYPEGVEALNPELLSAADVARLAEVATKIENAARGADKRDDSREKPQQLHVKVAFDVEPVYPAGALEGNVALPLIEQAPKELEPPAEDSS